MGRHRQSLDDGWAVRSTPAGRVTQPSQLAQVSGDWLEVEARGAANTAASALRSAGLWSLDAAPRRFDADDWWFRLRFDAPIPDADTQRALFFGGLATLADVWLNGEPLLQSTNMHLSHLCEEPRLHATGNELTMRFGSVDAWLAARRRRPRWRAPMIEHQQLRWLRTTLLGRTPGWSPPAAAAGPWGGVSLIETRGIKASDTRIRASVEGVEGRLSVALTLKAITASTRITGVQLEVERGGVVQRGTLRAGSALPSRYEGTLTIQDVDLWWPHTHGEPALYAARVLVHMAGRDQPEVVDLDAVGFRSIAVDTADGNFAVTVNGVAIFCRGACWTPLDAVSLRSTPDACRAALQQVRDAGMNMLRVSGSMVYEEDHFHDICDRLGILVWQDFMFANMDYPNDDAAFAASAREEVAQQLARLHAHPSLAVLCGNSEVEQQAAMWGASREVWEPPLFHRDIAELCKSACPDVPYWPSSAHGGSFPHRNDAGTTSYYGVGAYLRPLEDARRSGTRFATECLAFANVPSDQTLARIPTGAPLRSHHAAWKERSPRDLGAGWDFDDVRDHYLQRLYGVDATRLRSEDHDRYLAMSRAAVAEVMRATLSEWRRPGSSCHGALVWFLRDLWPGAGWGLLDDQGGPKSAFHGLRSAFAPISMSITDEGTNGLDLHVVNEPARALEASIEVCLYRDDGLLLERVRQSHTVAARGSLTLPIAQWFDRLMDLARAYRFGPCEHALVAATLRTADDAEIAHAFHFPEGLPNTREGDIGLTAQAFRQSDGTLELVARTQKFAQSIEISMPGFAAQNEYFHLAPDTTRRVLLTPVRLGAEVMPRGEIRALNTRSASRIEVVS
jgi:beta-mannosidase